jgi:DNA-binding beta-propeller fold protein YncE
VQNFEQMFDLSEWRRYVVANGFVPDPPGSVRFSGSTWPINVTNLHVPPNVVVEPSDRFAYVADQGFTNRGTSGGDIAIFEIDTTSTTCGAPSFVFTSRRSHQLSRGCPFDLAIDPTGEFLYRSEIHVNNVLEYQLTGRDAPG